MFKLTKISAHSSTSVNPGRSVIGHAYSDNDDVVFEIDNLDQVRVGKKLMVASGFFNFIKTSEISEILEKTDISIKFKTQTSIYLLESVE